LFLLLLKNGIDLGYGRVIFLDSDLARGCLILVQYDNSFLISIEQNVKGSWSVFLFRHVG